MLLRMDSRQKLTAGKLGGRFRQGRSEPTQWQSGWVRAAQHSRPRGSSKGASICGTLAQSPSSLTSRDSRGACLEKSREGARNLRWRRALEPGCSGENVSLAAAAAVLWSGFPGPVGTQGKGGGVGHGRFPAQVHTASAERKARIPCARGSRGSPMARADDSGRLPSMALRGLAEPRVPRAGRCGI